MLERLLISEFRGRGGNLNVAPGGEHPPPEDVPTYVYCAYADAGQGKLLSVVGDERRCKNILELTAFPLWGGLAGETTMCPDGPMWLAQGKVNF